MRFTVPVLAAVLAAFLGFPSSSCASAPDFRQIRLRAETISTPEPDRHAVAPQAAIAEPAVTGLYLVQFTNHLESVWRDELRTRGVELLHFVPDDAFVAHVQDARLGSLRALPYVRWVGAFEPRHKLHPAVLPALAAAGGARIPVKLLARANASGAELAGIAKTLRGDVRHHRLEGGTLFDGAVNATGLLALAKSPAVLWIERAPRMKMMDEVATKIIAGETDQPGTLAHVQELGFDGRDVTVAVADSGLDAGDVTIMHPDIQGRVDALFAYGGLPDASDEHGHGTHCAGIVAGDGFGTGETDDAGDLWGLGVAPGAHLVGQRIFDAAGNYFPPATFEQLTRDAVRSGAYVGSNSWGDDTAGQYDLSAHEFDALVRDADKLTPGEQAYVLEFSAGNAGPAGQTVGSPAVAKNVIATGACQNNRFDFPIYGEGQEVTADFSSRGPCEDGRIKPDLMAPGTWISSLRSLYANDDNDWSPIDDYYLYMGGTSQAGPHASGACAVFVQWYREKHSGVTPSPALVKAGLINSATDMSTAEIPDTGGGDIFGDGGDTGDGGTIVVGDTGPVPNNDEGWGRIDLENLIDSERRFDFTDQGAGLSNGQSFERRVIVGSAQPLKITLVYTDVPALPAAIPALVNDLDLEVIAPDGRLFRGNAFADGESVAGTPVGDGLNNVEAVHLSQPSAGEYIIHVRAKNVVTDVHGRSTGAAEQDFALVISGQLPLPGEGVVSWDRDSYRASVTAGVRLVDAQLSAQATTAVLVSSTTQPAGFTLTLNRVGASGSFTGSVALTTNAPANDGQLHVHDGDELTVRYTDADPAGVRTATAAVDSQPPAISDVTSVNRFGRTTISWLTGEPANSFVYYGTTNAVTNVVSDVAFRTQHSSDLPVLEAGTTYFYLVVSTDKAGNTTTNNNDGHYYRFIGSAPTRALLVYTHESLLEGDFSYPGVEYWTSSLDATGVDYEVWDLTERDGPPKLEDLKPYRVVLWRPEELATPSASVVTAIAGYVQQGGSLFVSSFDLLTRLTETQLTNFISGTLHVASFDEDQGANSIAAVPGEPVAGGINLDLDYSQFPDLLGFITWPDGPDHLHVDANSAPVFLQEGGRPVALRYPKTGVDTTGGRVVFCSFAFEAVPDDAPAPNNRDTLLANVLEFLVPGLEGISSLALDQSAYTVPGTVAVEVTDSHRAGKGSLQAEVAVAGVAQQLRLDETPRAGVFRGRFTLVSPGDAAGPGRFRAANTDQVTVDYVDDTGRADHAVATVDTAAPKITVVVSEAAYNEAAVVWTTDKPADALVQFGESGGDASFLTRSAYSAELATDHGVVLTGLLPDRDYFFQVVSRDAAGNVATDDNGRKFYVVHTLKPLPAPWTDNLEGGDTGWAVENTDPLSGALIGDDEGDGGGFTSAGWELGTPQNSLGITAHSGAACWATNLRNEPVDLAFTDLLTPAIDLTGGNHAMLHWSQYYDFSDQGGGGEDDPFGDIHVETGQVSVTTDDGATWNDVYALTDESSLGAWENVDVDLSRFVGQVVRVRFDYQLFSFSTVARTGWFVDDLNLELNRVAVSSITVTNNLSQARFTLTGPATVQGAGRTLTTNVPPGDYAVTWTPVAFYNTPAPQNVTLADKQALTVAGTYTFTDANHNGISDAWEQKYFGSVSPVHPPETDSDGDGASDFTEFLAGTSPNDVTSILHLRGPIGQPNRTVRFEWPSVDGREYRLEVSNDLAAWQPVSEDIRGNGLTLSTTLPALDPRLPYFFRVRVLP